MVSIARTPIKIWITSMAILFVSIVQADDAIDELRRCAKIPQVDSRLACYETLGARVLREERVEISESSGAPRSLVQTGTDGAAPTAAAAPSADVIGSLPDNFGGGKFERPVFARARITSCEQGVDKKWSFYFENGQIWKQSNTGRHQFETCYFMATITKDMFGYKMQIDDQNEKMRISRKR
jgi:hypothetical protein